MQQSQFSSAVLFFLFVSYFKQHRQASLGRLDLWRLTCIPVWDSKKPVYNLMAQVFKENI